MPIVCLVLWFLPVGVGIAELHNEHIKENNVNEMCMQKFNKPDEIKNCKAVLMKMEIKQ